MEENLYYKDVIIEASGYTVTLPAAAAAAVLVIVTFLFAAIFFVAFLRERHRFLERQELLTRALEENVKISQAAEMAKNQLLFKIIHDIKTPINSILGSVKMVREHRDDSKILLQYIDRISVSSNHLMHLSDNVLDMSKLLSGRNELKKTTFTLDKLVEDCISVARGQASGQKIVFQKEYRQISHGLLFGDETKLRQVIINILTNAVKFTPDYGKILLRVTETSVANGRVQCLFEIKDTGIGMSSEFQRRMFDPFERECQQPSKNDNGAGLGMTIVKEYVDLMGGKIEVDSEINKGTCFKISLILETREPLIGQIAVLEEKHHDLSGMRILLAEDNRISREMTSNLLEEYGAIVLATENGKYATDSFAVSRYGSFDAVLLDLVMPECDGITAARQIRALKRSDAETVAIIMMTATDSERDLHAALAEGVDRIIAKPVDYDVLICILQEAYAQNKDKSSALPKEF